LLHKKIIRIQLHFLNSFEDSLEHFDGDISIFEKFKEKLKKIVSCSMEGTKVYYEYYENLIPRKFVKKTIDLYDLFFCNESCLENFENLYSKYIHFDDHFEIE